MCTQHSRDEVTVCDVAIADVRTALRGVATVTYEHQPWEGTQVVNTEPRQRARFRRELAAAIARHGGSLPEGAE